MKILLVAVLGALLGANMFAQQGAVTPPHTHLKVGDSAPHFTLPATTGDKVTLSSFRGKAPVVLAFFPAAFTGGCTKEMLGYQANLAKFEGAETKVFGISGDNTPSQKEFGKQLNVSFPILSDFAQRKVMADSACCCRGWGWRTALPSSSIRTARSPISRKARARSTRPAPRWRAAASPTNNQSLGGPAQPAR